MSIEPEPLPPDKFEEKPISLAKLATIFAVTFCIAFGLCAVTAISGGMSSGTVVIQVSAVVEAICIVGLLVVALMAIVRSINK